MSRKSNQRSGFVIGTILLVIVLIAAITAFIASTNSRTDITGEIGRIDVMNFRNGSGDLLRGIQRIASACTVVDSGANEGSRASLVYFRNCIQEMRASLRAEPPCETDSSDRRCPYSRIYGGAHRAAVPLKMINANDVKWDLSYDVLTTNGPEPIDIVLFFDKLNDKACRAIEQTVLDSGTAQVTAGNALKNVSGQTLSIARKEGCYRYNATDHQYFLVIGSFYE